MDYRVTNSLKRISHFISTMLTITEKKVSYALPVSHHDGRETLLHRPTQGWTVDEAWILLHRSIYSLTVQPWVGRWSIQPAHPWRLNEVGS